MKKAIINKAARAKHNPLADYPAQISSTKYKKVEKIGNTDLPENCVFPLMGLNVNTDISFRQEKGNFPFSKLIITPSSKRLICSLQPSSVVLLIWILLNLEYRSDEIKISFTKFSSQMAANTFNKSIAELEQKGIIHRIGKKRTIDYWNFFINPQILYRGDALKFYREVVELHPEFLPRIKK